MTDEGAERFPVGWLRRLWSGEPEGQASRHSMQEQHFRRELLGLLPRLRGHTLALTGAPDRADDLVAGNLRAGTDALAAVERQRSACRLAAARYAQPLEAIRRVSLIGRVAVDRLAREEVPDAIPERVWPLERASGRAGFGYGWAAPIWAAAVFLSLGLGIGTWFTRSGEAPMSELAMQPVAWHPQAAWYHNLAAERQARSQPLLLDLEHREAPPLEAALLERLERSVAVPDLSGYGLELLGARLLVERVHPLAQIFYRDPAGGLVSLLLALDTGPDAPPRFQRVGETPVLSWREDGTAYVLAGDGTGSGYTGWPSWCWSRLDGKQADTGAGGAFCWRYPF